MDKVELYRQVFNAYRELCAKGEVGVSFSRFCREHGVDSHQMRWTLGKEFVNIKKLPGYKSISTRCSEVYESFKILCSEGRQPGAFAGYYKSFGIGRRQMERFMNRNNLRITDLPGFAWSNGRSSSRYKEVPFEDVIFEEAGFLPADSSNVITVKVDGHVAVSFPADTDVAVIARFVRKIGKETGDVGA